MNIILNHHVNGQDAGKRIKDRKRHIVIDMIGLRVGINVHSAEIQVRDVAMEVLKALTSGRGRSG